MEYKDLQKMTVKKLREEASKLPDIAGITGMKKAELIEALCEILKIEKPTKVVKKVAKRTKDVIKSEIKKFKESRVKILESNDKKELKKVRFHIKRLKRELRRIEA
jgi:hypothetical protein